MLGLPCTPHDYRRNTRQDHPVLSVPHEAEAAVVSAASIDLVLELIDAGHLAVSRAGLLALGAPPAGRPVDFDRVEGMLLGLAIGDALGNTSEGRSPTERRAAHGEVRDYLPNWYAARRSVGLPSDDTQLAFWTLEHLLEHGRIVPDRLAELFVRRRIFGIGRTVRAFAVGKGRAAIRRQWRSDADRSGRRPSPWPPVARTLGRRDPRRRRDPQRSIIHRGVRLVRRSPLGCTFFGGATRRRMVARPLL